MQLWNEQSLGTVPSQIRSNACVAAWINTAVSAVPTGNLTLQEFVYWRSVGLKGFVIKNTLSREVAKL